VAAQDASAIPRIFLPDAGQAKGLTRKMARKTISSTGRWLGALLFVAYPAEYGNSGVMTFMVGKDRVIYQQKLGQDDLRDCPRHGPISIPTQAGPKFGQ